MYRLWTKDKCHYGAKCRFAHVNSGNYDVFKGGIEGKFTKPIEKEVCVYCEKTGHSHTKCFKLKRDKKKATGEDKRPDTREARLTMRQLQRPVASLRRPRR